MTDRFLPPVRMVTAGNVSPEEEVMPHLLSSRFLSVIAKRMIRKPDVMYWVLSTWDPSMEETPHFLQFLTGEMGPDWWMQQPSAVRKQILGELLRMDDERGIITDWLAAIVREIDQNNGIAAEIVEQITWRNPLNNVLAEEMAALWSRYLLSSREYGNPAILEAVEKCFLECKNPRAKMKKILRTFQKAMKLLEKMSDGAGAEEVMEALSQKMAQVVTRRFLQPAPAVLSDRNTLKKDILGKLEVLNTWMENMRVGMVFRIIRGLMDEIERWEDIRNSAGEVLYSAEQIFYDVWLRLRQWSGWEFSGVRKNAIKALAVCLETKLAQGESSSRLESLWLETLREEKHLWDFDFPLKAYSRDLWVIALLSESQSRLMKICPGFCPASMEVWKALAQSEYALLRCKAWEILVLPENEWKDDIGAFLVERLPEEKDIDTLKVMARWRPLPGKPFPPGFWKAWTSLFERLWMKRYGFDIEYRLGRIISVGKDLVQTCALTWFEGQLGLNSQPVNPADTRRCLEKLADMANILPYREIARQVENVQKYMEALCQLDLNASPTAFLDNFEGAGLRHEDKDVWRNLLKAVTRRDPGTLSVNARQNLGVVAAILLSQVAESLLKQGDTELNVFKSFMEFQFYEEKTGHPEWIPAGWTEFCREFRHTCTGNDGTTRLSGQQIKKVCAMIRIGQMVQATGNCQYHQLFWQTLCQVLKSEDPILTSVLTNILWHEAVRDCKMAERLGPAGKGLDEAGQRRWLRQFLQIDGRIICRQASGESTTDEKIREFLNSLWAGLNTCLPSEETTGDSPEPRVELPDMNCRDLVFAHPYRDRNTVTEPARLQPVRNDFWTFICHGNHGDWQTDRGRQAVRLSS